MPRHRRAASLPAGGFLREPEVLLLVPLSRSTLWRRVKLGEFPKPLRLGGSRSRAVAWRRADVDEWLNGLTVTPVYAGGEAGE